MLSHYLDWCTGSSSRCPGSCLSTCNQNQSNNQQWIHKNIEINKFSQGSNTHNTNIPSRKLLLNLRGTWRRYLILPVPVVFLLIAFMLQLSDPINSPKKNQQKPTKIHQKQGKWRDNLDYICGCVRMGSHKQSSGSSGDESYDDRSGRRECGSCSGACRSFPCPSPAIIKAKRIRVRVGSEI